MEECFHTTPRSEINRSRSQALTRGAERKTTMVQHVLIIPSPFDGKPIADPIRLNIWRDDQEISWKITSELTNAGWGWDNDGPGGPNAAIQFADTPPWQGGQPEPTGTAPETGADVRQYTANGPGANLTNTTARFHYTMYFSGPDGKYSHDPEIGNQPQP